MSEGNMPDNLMELTARVVAAYVNHNQTPQRDVPDFIRQISAAFQGLSSGAVPVPDDESKPYVPIKKSIGDDFIICLIDGKKLTMLKRYLRSQYGISPDEYRKRFNLPHDYPMVAPAYARLRSAFAKKIGLGRIPTLKRGRKKTVAKDTSTS